MRAISIKGDAADDIRPALKQQLSGGFRPTLAFVFLSVKQDREAITALLHQEGIRVFGATTGGEISDGEISEGAISILLTDMDPSAFTILLEEYREEDAITVTKRMTQQALQHFSNPSFIISSSVNDLSEMYVGEQIVFTIAEVAGAGAAVWGGGAGDDLEFRETFVFTGDKESNRGILMLVIDADKVIVKGLAAAGQKPVGTEKTITKATDNWILEIDHQPAAEFMPKFIGLTLHPEEHEDFKTGVIILSLARETGAPVIRSSMGFNFENKGMAITGHIQAGDKIRLTLPPDFEVVEEVSNNARLFRESEMPEADALLVFSCIGRLDAFGPMTGDELQGIQRAYGVPMAGFFSYGEYGRATGGKNEFHNMTCCWVALKEK